MKHRAPIEGIKGSPIIIITPLWLVVPCWDCPYDAVEISEITPVARGIPHNLRFADCRAAGAWALIAWHIRKVKTTAVVSAGSFYNSCCYWGMRVFCLRFVWREDDLTRLGVDELRPS